MKSLLMASLSAVVVGAIAGASVLSQETPPAVAPDEPAAQEESKAPAPDPVKVAEAQKLIGEVAQAYKSAKTLSDTITMDIKAPMGGQTLEMKIAVGPGEDASISMPGMTFTAHDGKFYAIRDDIGDKYLVIDLQGGMYATIENLLGDTSFIPPQITLRDERTPQQQINSVVMNILQDAQAVGHQMAKLENGDDMHEVLLTADFGNGSVFIDPKSKFIHRVALKMTHPSMGESNVTLKMAPQAHEALPTPIAFNGGERKAVSTLEELEPTPIKEGDVAPEFALPTLDGETVKLSDLKGSAVVLDFWATWCGPCKAALPKLDEFAKWASTSSQPIKVYAVDVWERFRTPEETKTKVGEFWKTKGYSFPTLLDLDNSVVKKYGFSSIPTTVIVGPDGKIAKIHSGFDPGMVEQLKKDVEEALKSAG